MKKSILFGALALLAHGITASAQTAPVAVWYYAWSNGPLWFRLGPTLAVTNGQMDVQLPALSLPTKRHYDVPLAYDRPNRAWVIPAGASNLVVYVNGLRYSPANYTIAAGLLTANGANMLPEHEVTADYDAI